MTQNPQQLVSSLHPQQALNTYQAENNIPLFYPIFAQDQVRKNILRCHPSSESKTQLSQLISLIIEIVPQRFPPCVKNVAHRLPSLREIRTLRFIHFGEVGTLLFIH